MEETGRREGEKGEVEGGKGERGGRGENDHHHSWEGEGSTCT